MLFVAHNSQRYGYLEADGKPIPDEQLARRCGCGSVEEYRNLLAELFSAGVPSRTPEGVIYSRRMVRRVIAPAISRCVVCRKPEEEHKAEGHLFKRDSAFPEWHGWHAFRRGVATNLHTLGVDDKTIQDSAAQQYRDNSKHLHQERHRIAGERNGHARRKIQFVQRECNVRGWAGQLR